LSLLALGAIAASSRLEAQPIEVAPGLRVDFVLLSPRQTVGPAENVRFDALLINDASSTRDLLGANMTGIGFSWGTLIRDNVFAPQNPYGWAIAPDTYRLHNAVVRPGQGFLFTFGVLSPLNPPVGAATYSASFGLGYGFCCQLWRTVEVRIPGVTESPCVSEPIYQSIDLGDTCLIPSTQRTIPFDDGSHLGYVTPNGERRRIAQCLFKDGLNFASYSSGHLPGGTRSCLGSARWVNLDGASNDGPRVASDFTGNPVVFSTYDEPYLDVVEYAYVAPANKLSWKNRKYEYSGDQYGTDGDLSAILTGRRLPLPGLGFSVDPSVGAETESMFDALWLQLQSEPGPGTPMRFIPGCDLDGNGTCDEVDQALLEGATGACHGQPGYIMRTDLDGDGCISDAEASATEASGTEYRSGCTRSHKYWKDHAGSWPANHLSIGGEDYSGHELLRILSGPVRENGAVRLAHQLIAAKLNEAAGASAVAAPLATADALLAELAPGRLPPLGGAFTSPDSVSTYVLTLNAYNRGSLGPPACAP
jgi:hypothetical protein